MRRPGSRCALYLVLTLTVLLALATACSPKVAETRRQSAGQAQPAREQVVVEKEAEKVVEKVVQATAVVEQPAFSARQGIGGGGTYPAPAADQAQGKGGGEDSDSSDGGGKPRLAAYREARMIIKNGEIKLEVAETSSAIDRVTQVADDTGGYILSSRSWYENSYQYATITLGIPVDEFENALQRLRKLALRVIDEQIAGADVTDEYVDQQSRLTNLEATEARIRSFLEKADSVEESLRINAQLSEITGQIEQVKGRMNYLKDRAAYSTVTVHLTQAYPTPTPTMTFTPTPTLTPTPTATPDIWRPGQTVIQASSVLGSIIRAVVDVFIWVVVVLGPIVAPLAVVVGLISRRRGPRLNGNSHSDVRPVPPESEQPASDK